jgi:hypothetical protein
LSFSQILCPVLRSTEARQDLQLLGHYTGTQPPICRTLLDTLPYPNLNIELYHSLDSSQSDSSLLRASGRHRPIVFASLTLSLVTRLSSHHLFVLRKKGCETLQINHDLRLPISLADTSYASFWTTTSWLLRYYKLPEIVDPNKLLLRHFGSNRSASEVRWLTERFPRSAR